MVISIVMVIIGTIVMKSLPISQFPDIVPPVINVSTTYYGASALDVEQTVATPLEQNINGVENMIYMKSINANDGTMNLQVSFEVGSDLDISNVLTEVSGSYLKIHMRDGRYRNRNVKVYVTYVSLNKLHVSSAANVFSDGTIKAKTMDISASSAGSAELSIDAESVSIDASSAGDIVLEGRAVNIEVEVSSAGEIDAYGLESENGNASASSAGSAKISVSKELTAQASSGGSIRYRGSPAKTNTSSSSGGSVKKSN